MNKDYEEIIHGLRKIEPVPTSDKKLTEDIMNKIEMVPKTHSRYLRIDVSDNQWRIIKIVRLSVAVAALYFLGYLTFLHSETYYIQKEKTTVFNISQESNPTPDNTGLSVNKPVIDYNKLRITGSAYVFANQPSEKFTVECHQIKNIWQIFSNLKIKHESIRDHLLKKYGYNTINK
jgi:hypothetical protein